ncbi:homoserine kinase [Thiomicrospira sp. ALE5]|uniref:homoserine kinase n=1 Tax=Thiomicrospira sp. ALE5 TaxID=748650 RepID=UPI0008ED5159|nr:homoserine kinase [Thiomicrospira sp. ALE5]SFR63972.1 homoserine kinase [Thiomicrospira sp. ALE5]
MSVYTKVASEQLEVFLAQYSVGHLISYDGINAGIENTNYFVDTDQARFVLTIFEHHDADELGYFLDIMAFMAQNAIPTALPQADKRGSYLNVLCGKPAALVERLNGVTLENPTIDQCHTMAKTLARFHKVGTSFSGYRANDRGLDWAEATFNKINTSLSKCQIDMIDEEIHYQKSVDWHALPQSVIHADLFTDNAMFDGDQLTGIIDLYYACQGPCLYDLAVMVNDWCRDKDNRLKQDYVNVVLKAYQAERALTHKEQACWPAALRMAALRFYLSRLKDKITPREGELTMIKNPDVFEQLLQSHRALATKPYQWE